MLMKKDNDITNPVHILANAKSEFDSLQSSSDYKPTWVHW